MRLAVTCLGKSNPRKSRATDATHIPALPIYNAASYLIASYLTASYPTAHKKRTVFPPKDRPFVASRSSTLRDIFGFALERLHRLPLENKPIDRGYDDAKKRLLESDSVNSPKSNSVAWIFAPNPNCVNTSSPSRAVAFCPTESIPSLNPAGCVSLMV